MSRLDSVQITPEQAAFELRLHYEWECPDCWQLEDGQNCPRHEAQVQEYLRERAGEEGEG